MLRTRTRPSPGPAAGCGREARRLRWEGRCTPRTEPDIILDTVCRGQSAGGGFPDQASSCLSFPPLGGIARRPRAPPLSAAERGTPERMGTVPRFRVVRDEAWTFRGPGKSPRAAQSRRGDSEEEGTPQGTTLAWRRPRVAARSRPSSWSGPRVRPLPPHAEGAGTASPNATLSARRAMFLDSRRCWRRPALCSSASRRAAVVVDFSWSILTISSSMVPAATR